MNYISRSYDFININKTITDIITSCDFCQKRKTLTCKTKEIIVRSNAHELFESIFIDFCGPFKTTITGKKYIFAITDQFSKYTILKAVTSQDDKTITRLLLNE